MAVLGLDLSREELARYSRHLVLPEVGLEGQRKLKAAKVLAVGAGGLGSPVSLYLAAAGVGTLGVVDFDRVDVTNLQRQVLHSTEAIGKPKIDSARSRVAALNPEVRFIAHAARLTSANALEIVRGYDLVVDGSDNFPTRYLANDACALLGKPYVYGSVYRFEGQASVFDARCGPCYRCLFPQPPAPGTVPSCEEGGVLGVLPGIIGLIQATEAIKLVLGAGEPLLGRLLVFDALGMRFRELKLRKDPRCPICGTEPSIHELVDYEAFCGLAPRSETTAMSDEAFEITPKDVKAKLDAREPFELLDVRDGYELEIAALPYTKHIPLAELPLRLGELAKDRETVVYCRSGSRSGRAAQLMRKSGFTKVKNLAGGILAYADDVDATLQKY